MALGFKFATKTATNCCSPWPTIPLTGTSSYRTEWLFQIRRQRYYCNIEHVSGTSSATYNLFIYLKLQFYKLSLGTRGKISRMTSLVILGIYVLSSTQLPFWKNFLFSPLCKNIQNKRENWVSSLSLRFVQVDTNDWSYFLQSQGWLIVGGKQDSAVVKCPRTNSKRNMFPLILLSCINLMCNHLCRQKLVY